MSTRDTAVRLLGRQVRAVYARPSETADGRGCFVTGQLRALGDGGDFAVLGEDGFMMHCWPLLEIEEL